MEEFSTLDDVKKKYIGNALKTKFVTQHDMTRKFCVFKNFEHFRNEYPRLSCLHEVVFAHSPRKFVVDIEQKIEISDKSIYVPIFHSQVAGIKDLIKSLFSVKYSQIITDENFIMIDSCGEVEGKYKFSINIVVNGYYFANYQEFKYFGLALVELYNGKIGNGLFNQFIDPSFYTRNDVYSQFQIRIPGHSKHGEDRPKIVLGNIDPLLGIISNIEGCIKLRRLYKEKEAKKKYKQFKNIPISCETETILNLTKHIWDQNFTFRSRDGDILSFDRIRPSFCKFCNEDHHKDNQFYMIYSNGSVWERCRHDMSKSSRFVVAITDNSEPIPTPIVVKDPSRLDPNKMFPPNKNVYLIKAHMKMGKTEECIKYINQTQPKTIVLLSFRRTFGEDMRSRYRNFELYSDITGKISLAEHPRLIVQIESLDRIVYPLPDISLVILDEVESIWSQFSHNQIGDFHSVISTFKNILGLAKKIICMDADLCSRTVRLLRLIRPDFDNECNFYKNNHNPSAGTVYSFLQDKTTAITLLSKQLSSGKKVVVVTNSIKTSKEIYAWLSDRIKNIKIGLYNSETKESKKSKHSRDVNRYWSKYDCLIYTPTITSGVSFTQIHFDTLFGIFTTGSCNVETCRQMIGRIRNLTDQHVYIHITTTDRPDDEYPTKSEIIRDYMKYERAKLLEYAQKKYNVEQLVFDYTPSGAASYYENLAYYIISENIAYDNKSRNSFIGLFIKYLKNSFFEVRENVDPVSLGLTGDEMGACDFTLKMSSKELNDKITSDIYSSPKIDAKVAEEIKTKIKIGLDITSEERNSMAYYKLSRQLQVPLTKEIIDVYKSAGSSQSTRVRQYIACRDLFDIRNKNKKDFKNLVEYLGADNYLKDAVQRYSSVVHEMVSELFTEIDFGKSLVTLMIERTPMRYPQIDAVTTNEHNRIRIEYWQTRLPKFKEYVEKISAMTGYPKSRKLADMDHLEVLGEFIYLLSKIYGLCRVQGTIYGSPYIIFVYNGVRYLSGKRAKDTKQLPIVTIG